MLISKYKKTIAKLKSVNLTILFILLIAFILRVWELGNIPPHLSPDEASLGYNAYSILKTGRDEYGKLLPLIFKSFGDYKPGLYIYLSVPFIFLFGLNEFAVRLPSALAGTAAVWLLYLIIKEFKEDKKLPRKAGFRFTEEIIAPALLALNPWHLHFSRGAWEVNVALTLTLAGIYFFLKSLKNFKYFLAATIAFAATFLLYQGAKLSTPLVIAALGFVYLKRTLELIRANIKLFLISCFAGLIICLPVVFSVFQGQVGRLGVFSIFSYKRSSQDVEKILSEGNEKIGDLSYYLFHSEGLNFTRAVMGRYFNHFSGRFLFFEGDYQNPKHSSPNSGVMLICDLVFLAFGIVALIKMGNKFSKFSLVLLILAPLPAALSRDEVQAVRSFNMVIPLVLISSCGLVFLVGKIRKVRFVLLRLSYYILLTAIFIGSLVYFMDSYFIHLPIHDAKYWNWGYKQVVEVVTPIQKNYQKIYFQQSYDQPYIYFLFYQKYDPTKYQKQAKLQESQYGDVGLVEKLDNIYFLGWSWPFATGEKNTLIIGNDVAIPSDWSRKDYSLVAEIKYPDKFMTAFRILETK
jgi:4-amino-4-deoxy-L-arabinose transferase-like glycosyltransferase